MNSKMSYKFELLKDETYGLASGIDCETAKIPETYKGAPVTEIGPNAFSGMENITSLIVPEGVVRICEGAFENCINLEKVVFPSTLRVIGERAFCNCEALRIVDFPRELEIIGPSAFKGCGSLQIGHIPPGLNSIGLGAFAECSSIVSFTSDEVDTYPYIVIDGGIYDLRERSLAVCPPGRLIFSIVPGFTIDIAPGAFMGCNVSILNISSYRGEINADTFMGANYLKEVKGPKQYDLIIKKGVYTEKGKHMVYWPAAADGKVQIKEGTVDVADNAFHYCVDVRSIDIPSTLESIYDKAFEHLESLTEINIAPGATVELPVNLVDEEGNAVCGQEASGHTYTKKGDVFVRSHKYKPRGDDPFESDSPFKRGFRDREERVEFTPVDIEGVTFDNIAGNGKIKEDLIDRVVNPLVHKDIYKKLGIRTGTGVLMYGVPGTGKTLMARAVASSLGAKFFSVRPSDILAKYVGESESRIKSLFDAARAEGNAVIFIDDFDSLGVARGNDKQPWKDDMLVEFLTQMQGVEEHDGNLLVLAATNRPWAIDSALLRPGRFDIKVNVPLPDYEARKGIFEIAMSGCEHESLDFDKFARLTEGFNGADIEDVCQNAKIHRAKIAIAGGSVVVDSSDFDKAFEGARSSVNKHDLDLIERFEAGEISPGDDLGTTYTPAKNAVVDPFYG